MGRRRMLRGVAYNIAHQFAGSAEHYAYMASEEKVSVVKIDLLSGVIAPDVFGIRRNRILAERCQTTLKGIVERSIPGDLRAARLLMTNDAHESGDSPSITLVTVTLTDDRGREWGGDRSLKAWWMDGCYGSGHFFA